VSKRKLAKFSEMEQFEHVIQAPYHKIQELEFKLKGKWATDFFKNTDTEYVKSEPCY